MSASEHRRLEHDLGRRGHVITSGTFLVTREIDGPTNDTSATSMLANYIRLAIRSLTKDKIRAAIEVFGLSVGLACSLLIMLFVSHETSFDSFHHRSDDIYRVWVKEDYGQGRQYFNSLTPIVLSNWIDKSISGVDETVRLGVMNDLVTHADTRFTGEVHLVDANFFQVFDFELLQGDRRSALLDPHSAVLTLESAKKIFGTTDVMGSSFSIRFGDRHEEFRVTGLSARPPANSSVRYEIMVPFAMAEQLFSPEAVRSWFSVTVETYVMATPNVAVDRIQTQFPSMLSEALGDRYERSGYEVGLQPLRSIHLDPSVPEAFAPVSNPVYSYILGAIALLILVIACINYMTLSIGRSVQRAVEVGVRKSIGAGRRQLMRQFWGEALVTCVIALIIGVALAETFRPLFNQLAGTQLGSMVRLKSLASGSLLCLVVALISGGYPALILSKFRPADVLKGDVRVGGDRSLVRRGLVTVQFAVSVFLITVTLVMGRQFSYLQNRPLGFDRDHVLVVPLPIAPSHDRGVSEVVEDGMTLAHLMRDELSGRPGIGSSTAAGHSFGENWTSIGFKDERGRYYDMQMNAVGDNYLETMGMRLVAGRAFALETPSDRKRAIVVNEALVQAFGLEDVIGGRLPGSRFPDHEIIGVVEDFNYESLHGNVRPLVLAMNPDIVLQGASDVSFDAFPVPKIMIRVSPTNIPATIAHVEEAFEAVAPGQDFKFSFLDATIDAQYRREQRLGEIVQISSVLAVLIACLGLFGLAGLAVVRRTKEIGVRKVLGASGRGVFWLLARDFAGIILISTLLAAPVAFIVMSRWLQDFAYRIELSPDLFVLAGLIVTTVALFTVAYQGIRAARMDPVQSLRYE